MTMYAIHASEDGTAVVAYTRPSGGWLDIERVERLPAGLDPVADWLHETFPALPDLGESSVVIDATAFGTALWAKLLVRGKPGWKLYAKQGRERQELVTALMVAMSDRRVHIHRSPHEAAIRKALAGYGHTVGDDGVVGVELVVALALAAFSKPRPALFVSAA